MEFKKTYTEEEIEELIAWFEKNDDKLPESLYVDNATFIKELRYTVHLYFPLVRERRESICFSGQVFFLFKIRKKLMEMGIGSE